MFWSVTPLLSRSIVLAKWLGTFRLVPIVAIGPGLLMLALATAPSNGRVAPAAGTVLLPSAIFICRSDLVAVAFGRHDPGARCVAHERRTGTGHVDQAAEPGHRHQRVRVS